MISRWSSGVREDASNRNSDNFNLNNSLVLVKISHNNANDGREDFSGDSNIHQDDDRGKNRADFKELIQCLRLSRVQQIIYLSKPQVIETCTQYNTFLGCKLYIQNNIVS